jgi:hypothetical protein
MSVIASAIKTAISYNSPLLIWWWSREKVSIPEIPTELRYR